MANLSCVEYGYNKALSYKAVSGGKMRIGTLVSNGMGGIGVIVDERWRTFKVHWATGESNWHDEIYLIVEVK